MSPKPPISRREYYDYINSEAWIELRRRYLRSRLSTDCYVCHAPYEHTFQLHHRTYRRVGKERIGLDVVFVCTECHKIIHAIARAATGSNSKHTWHATKLARRYRKRGRLPAELRISSRKRLPLPEKLDL